VSDRRYSTTRWQRLRLEVLAYYGGVCQIQGPRCAGRANTVHHLIPSSQAPELFWSIENLTASCGPCNYSDGARVAADNRRTAGERVAELEQQNQRLEEIVLWQAEKIEELALALDRQRPKAEAARKRARPAIL
jgi:5-methylcytosine-specific restriction endonuclease McrA